MPEPSDSLFTTPAMAAVFAPEAHVRYMLAFEAALGDTATPDLRRITIQQIFDAVTKYYNVRLSDLQSKKRHKSIAFPRQVCMFLARRHTRYSLEEIGGYFGGRDHTTVMHADKKIRNEIAQRRKTFEQVQELTARIKQRARS